ncbi:MAG TPA: RNA polymerase sigma factor [Acidimicrobiales bacterium]|jgi:RNA polymerase sigma-70 factor (ECF subfamily)
MTPGDQDPDLAPALQRGDRVAWDQFYRRLYPRLRSYFIRRLGHDGAEDAVSETMTKAIAAIDRYTPGAVGLEGWLFGIARHVNADHHRRSARVARQQQVAHLVDGCGLESRMPVDHDLDLSDEHAHVRSQFGRLEPAEQEVLELRVVAGLSANEVAAVLDKDPGAVRTFQSRALAHLRRLVEADRVDA